MAPAARQEMGLDLWQALLMVRRRIGLVLAFAAVTTGLATLVILDLPERWTAEALLVLNDRASRLSELQSSTESLLSRTQADLSIIKTQADILSSTALLPAVVRQLTSWTTRLSRGASSRRAGSRRCWRRSSTGPRGCAGRRRLPLRPRGRSTARSNT